MIVPVVDTVRPEPALPDPPSFSADAAASAVTEDFGRAERSDDDGDFDGATDIGVVGRKAAVHGEITTEDDLHVHGQVEGRLRVGGALFVHPTGMVHADVDARRVIVAGVIVGDVRATEWIELQHGGAITGDLLAERVIVSDGAVLRGSVSLRPGVVDFVDPAAPDNDGVGVRAPDGPGTTWPTGAPPKPAADADRRHRLPLGPGDGAPFARGLGHRRHRAPVRFRRGSPDAASPGGRSRAPSVLPES